MTLQQQNGQKRPFVTHILSDLVYPLFAQVRAVSQQWAKTMIRNYLSSTVYDTL